jgi:alkylhydroperoxidase family enzyme
MTDIRQLHSALVARLLGDRGKAPRTLRKSAFDGGASGGLSEPLRTLVEKVAHRSDQVTDDDVAAARAAGLTEDQIFEVVVCAAVGEAHRQYTSALAVLADATGHKGPGHEA